MSSASINTISAPVKLVIWDLDETFWGGTLSEEGIEPVQDHIAMIKTLVDRGIMCSICSKNDFSAAKSELQKLGVWDLFVFPHIQWSPKGQAIATMINKMNLRSENVVFIDDNHLNIQEAHFSNPGIMVVDGNGSQVHLLELPEFQGKDDADHSRIRQYKMMESKFSNQTETGLSNLDFLHQSGVKVKIIFDLDDQFDRIAELLNRTNQLNFTKSRANTEVEKAKLKELLATCGTHAGLVQVQDRYGDYGIVGFFCLSLKYTGAEVHHFSFSCRAMNMGIEQWVWEYLEKPEFKVVGPVANRLDEYQSVDWVSEVTDFEADEVGVPARRLCLVGGCDLLQVSFYCGTKRDEFVNKQDDKGRLVRFDDVGFFLNSRDDSLQNSLELNEFVGVRLEDMVALDTSLQQADIILLSMLHSATLDNLFTFGGPTFGGSYFATVPPRRMQKLMMNPKVAANFARKMYHRPYDLNQRLALTRRSFAFAAAQRRPQTPMFILSAVTSLGEQAERNRGMRHKYNAMCQDFCSKNQNTFFVDIETLLGEEDFTDSDHYTRTGYFKIADFVNRTSALAKVATQAA